MFEDSDRSTDYQLLVDALENNGTQSGKLLLAPDLAIDKTLPNPAAEVIKRLKNWASQKTRDQMIKEGKFRAYVSFPEALDSKDPLFAEILSSKYYWEHTTSEVRGKGRVPITRHYYRIKGDKITKSLPLHEIKYGVYTQGVYGERFFNDITANHEPTKLAKPKHEAPKPVVAENTAISDEDLAKAAAAYEVTFTGKRTTPKPDVNGKLTSPISYTIQMLEMPLSEADPHIKQRFPRYTALLEAWKKRGFTIGHNLEKTGNQERSAILIGNEEKNLRNTMPSLVPSLDLAKIAPYKIPPRACKKGTTDQLTFTSHDHGNTQKHTATLFITQEGDAHYLVVTAMCPLSEQMKFSLSSIGITLPNNQPFTTLEKDGQATNGHYGKIPIHPDLYADLTQANIPIPSGELEHIIEKTLADAATVGATRTEVAPKVFIPGRPSEKKGLTAEKLAECESDIAAIAQKASKSAEEAYLAATNDKGEISYSAYVLLETGKGAAKEIPRKFRIINDKYGFKNGEQRSSTTPIPGTHYSMFRISLTEEHYRALQKSGIFDPLENKVNKEEVQISEEGVIEAEAARLWLTQKTQEVNAEKKAENRQRKHSITDETLQLVPNLITAVEHTGGRVCRVTLPDVATINVQIEELKKIKPGFVSWEEIASNAPHRADIEAVHTAVVAMFADRSHLQDIAKNIAEAKLSAEKTVLAVKRELDRLKQTKAMVETYGQTVPAIVLRGPSNWYGSDWDKIQNAAHAPWFTEEGQEDYRDGSNTDKKDRRAVLRVHEVDLGNRRGRKNHRRGNQNAGVILLTPALWEAVQKGTKSPRTLSDQPIEDAQLNQFLIDHYEPKHEQEGPNPQDIIRDFDALGTQALVVKERQNSEVEDETIGYSGKVQASRTLAVRYEDKGAQPFVYIAVQDATTRSKAIKMLSTLHKHGLISGEKIYNQEHETSLVDDELLALHAQYKELKEMQSGKLLTDYAWIIQIEKYQDVEYAIINADMLEQMIEEPHYFLGLNTEQSSAPNETSENLVKQFTSKIDHALEKVGRNKVLEIIAQMKRQEPLTEENLTVLSGFFRALPRNLSPLFIEQSSMVDAKYRDYVARHGNGDSPYPDSLWYLTDASLTKLEAAASYGPRAIGVYGSNGKSEVPIGEEGILKESLPDPADGTYILRCPLSLETYNELGLDGLLPQNKQSTRGANGRASTDLKNGMKANGNERFIEFAQHHGIDSPALKRSSSFIE